jgi:hypothetical protein
VKTSAITSASDKVSPTKSIGQSRALHDLVA